MDVAYHPYDTVYVCYHPYVTVEVLYLVIQTFLEYTFVNHALSKMQLRYLRLHRRRVIITQVKLKDLNQDTIKLMTQILRLCLFFCYGPYLLA